MSVVIKNTFLDVCQAIDKPCGKARRCHSIPREWKPVSPSRKCSLAPSDDSVEDSSQSSRTWPAGALPSGVRARPSSEDSSDVSPSSTRSWPAGALPSGVRRPGLDACGLLPERNHHEGTPSSYSAIPVVTKNTFLHVVGHTFLMIDEPCGPARRCYSAPREWKPVVPSRKFSKTQTNGSTEGLPRSRRAPSSQPASKDTRMQAVRCMHLQVLELLASYDQVQNISVDIGSPGTFSTLISAWLESGPDASARAYNVMHLIRQALEAVAKRLQTTRLLSARIQKDSGGYSLRSSIACVPNGVQDRLCWDLFQNGQCPRGKQCQWYHPSSCDIAKIKICIGYDRKSTELKCGTVVETDPPAQSHKFRSGDLIN